MDGNGNNVKVKGEVGVGPLAIIDFSDASESRPPERNELACRATGAIEVGPEPQMPSPFVFRLDRFRHLPRRGLAGSLL